MDVTTTTTAPPQVLAEVPPSFCHVDLYTHSSNNNNIIATNEDPDSSISLKLTPCSICSRTFNPVTLQKHVVICEKMATKKRNIFDSSRQRREGTELASYPLPKNYGLPPVKHDRGQSPKPMQISSPILTRKKPVDELSRTTVRASVRKHTSTTPTIAQTAAAGTHTTTTSVAPSTVLTSNFSRDRMRSSERSLSKRIQPPAAEQCPYCERCFGVKAYDRHVEWCKEKALQASIKLTTKNEQNVAKERLEARTKYRAPCLKTKRSINRDKYAGLNGDENDSVDSPKSGNSTYNNNNISSNNIMSLSLTSSIMSDTTIPNHGTSNGAYNSRNSNGNKTNASNNHNSNNKNTACHAEQTSMPTHANKKDHLIRRSAEREVPDFRLNGEKCETSFDKRKKDVSAIKHAEDFNNFAVNDELVVASRRITVANTACNNETQDNLIEIHKSDRNDLSATFTTATTTTKTSPLLLTKSLTSLSRRKLKTKEHSATNLSITKRGLASEDVSSAAVSSKIVSSNEPKGKELQPSISLPHLQQQQQQKLKENSIFELPRYTKLKTTMSTTALSMHTKLETNPIKGPIICRPKRKKLQRQQNATSTPLKAIPLLKESIETFGLPAHTTVLVDKQKEIKIIKAPPSLTSLKTPPTLVRNKSFILRTKSNLDSMESNHNATFSNYDDLKSMRSTEDFDGVDQKKREIFISIETEQNDQGHSAISPDSLRSIVGGNQKPHVEEVSANDNKFSKIEDDDDRMPTSPTSQSFFEASQLPNIQLNNAKNLIQKMQDSFRHMGEEAGANLRHAVINSTPRSTTTTNSFCENSRSPLSTERSGVEGNIDGAAEGDSDDASSLESYPVSSQSSRRGVASKLSADSAYGSLSRQRSSEFANLSRNQIRSRPSTSNCGTNTAKAAPMIDAATQHQQQLQQQQKAQQQQQYYKVTTTRNRSRQFSADSSTSGSDVSLPPLVANSLQNHSSNSYQDQPLMSGTSSQNRFEQQQPQQQQQQQQIYDNSLNNNTYLESPHNSPTAPSTSTAASAFAEEASAAAGSSLGASSCSISSINNSSMTASMKMSRFCHECGTRFLIEQAKFCMDCGVKRIVL